MKNNYIIDGYNLGFKIPSIARWIRKGETDKAVKLIKNYVLNRFAVRADQLIIVFDGKAQMHDPDPQTKNLKVIYSSKPETADDIIRNFIRTVKNIRQWVVISSDNEIRYTAEDLGAKALSSEDFVNAYLEKSGSDLPINKEKYKPENIDLEYWLKKFNQK